MNSAAVEKEMGDVLNKIGDVLFDLAKLESSDENKRLHKQLTDLRADIFWGAFHQDRTAVLTRFSDILRTYSSIRNTNKKEQTMSTLNVESYTYKPFVVDAVQVTADNYEEVAKWCDAAVVTAPDGSFVCVKIKTTNSKPGWRSKAYVGYWILKSSIGYKVYTDKAFEKHFEKKN